MDLNNISMDDLKEKILSFADKVPCNWQEWTNAGSKRPTTTKDFEGSLSMAFMDIHDDLAF